MSLALVKNKIFPSKPCRQPDGKGDIAMSETTSKAGSFCSDVESQEDCGSEQSPRRRKIKFSRAKIISDSTIGLSDGLTVPFALTAGLSTLNDSRVVVLGGLAELIAGAISMGLGGYISARSEAESYNATLRTTEKLVRESVDDASSMVCTTLRPYGFQPGSADRAVQSMRATPSVLVEFLMKFHHQMPEPDASRPFVSALTIAMGYFLGGFVPLVPYFCVPKDNVLLGLWWSIGIMSVALFTFGWVKTSLVRGWSGKQNIIEGIKGALQMVIVGGVAAAAAVGLVRAISHGSI